MAKIFPIVLDTAAETVAAAGALPVTTSFVKVNPATSPVAYTVADGTVPGQVMYIQNIAAGNDADITFTTPFDSAANLVSLDDRGHSVTFMWTPSGWFPLSTEAAADIQ